MPIIEQLFSSRTRVKLLRLFLSRSDQQFFVRQLVRETGEHINSIRRELANLTAIGLLRTFEQTGKKYYKVNSEFILYPELKALILKSHLTSERSFMGQLQKLGRVRYLALLGYFIGDRAVATDLFIIGELPRLSLQKLLEEFNRRFGQELRYTLMSDTEYHYRRDVTDKFLFTIINSPQIVLVDEVGLQPAAQQLPKFKNLV